MVFHVKIDEDEGKLYVRNAHSPKKHTTCFLLGGPKATREWKDQKWLQSVTPLLDGDVVVYP